MAGKRRLLSLADKVFVVVGNVDTLGRGIASELLKQGATVVLPSKSESALVKSRELLGNPAGLCTILGDFQTDACVDAPSAVNAIRSTFKCIHGVVAHGGLVRGDDSSDSVLRGKSMLECEVGEILRDISDTLGMHVNAAQALLPLLVPSAARGQGNSPSYTLVTGGFENQFFESQLQAEVFTLTSLHGLSVALRNAKSRLPVRINELRIALQINRAERDREREPRFTPLSRDIGRIAASLATGNRALNPDGSRFSVNSNAELSSLISKLKEHETCSKARDLFEICLQSDKSLPL